MALADPCPACGKVCFTFGEARAKARKARRRRDPEDKGFPWTAYKCRTGGSSWHIGHTGETASHRKRRKK